MTKTDTECALLLTYTHILFIMATAFFVDIAHAEDPAQVDSLKDVCSQITGTPIDCLKEATHEQAKQSTLKEYFDASRIPYMVLLNANNLLLVVSPDYSIVYELRVFAQGKRGPLLNTAEKVIERDSDIFDLAKPILAWNRFSCDIKDFSIVNHNIGDWRIHTNIQCNHVIYRGAFVVCEANRNGRIYSFLYFPPVLPEETRSPSLHDASMQGLVKAYMRSVMSSGRLQEVDHFSLQENTAVQTVMTPLDTLIGRFRGNDNNPEKFQYCTEVQVMLFDKSKSLYGSMLLGFSNSSQTIVYSIQAQQEYKYISVCPEKH